MNDVTHIAACAGLTPPQQVAHRDARLSLWGVLCGASFVGLRASIYLIALPFAAVACLAGLVLYGVHALVRHA
jgi:hypothetical protein